jgi:hypothetical protein
MFDGPDLRAVMEVVGKKAIEEACAASDETLLAATVSELVDGIMSEIDMDPPVLERLSRPLWNFGDGGPGVIVTQ